ncbi:MAG: SAM-dependent methyltransferase [Lachnospiraceae bacterium]|nr:SAM-dependent methyltransferase [Lachnospiraceae bacterium]
MNKVRELLSQLEGNKLYQIIISNPKGKKEISKVKIRPIMIKEELLFQVSEWSNNQIFHKNLDKEEMTEQIIQYLEESFGQMELSSMDLQTTVLVSKKGKVTVKTKQIKNEKQIDLSHNKSKKYILSKDEPVPFLIDLGVQTKEGKIINSHYDKFRQINRYLEFVQDILPILPQDRKVNIIDFGCGKSYLTFALYYYLKVVCKKEINIIGLDLKEKVIENCNRLAKKYGYEDLKFITGDVSTYTGEGKVDMVVTLHACDTATDYALEKAIEWGAKVIFTVPCCQHEVNKQISCEQLSPILKYGLLRERVSALITDAVRANILEENGYQVQVMEFIDMEHTPKNILIRAVLDGKKRRTDIRKMTDLLNINTTLQKLMMDRGKE